MASGARHSGGFLLEPTVNYASSKRSLNSDSSAAERNSSLSEPAKIQNGGPVGDRSRETPRDRMSWGVTPAVDDTSGGLKRSSGLFGKAREGLRIRRMRAPEPLGRSQNTFVARQPAVDGHIDTTVSEATSKDSTARSTSASAIDPNQLVRMALSLSESRRLHLSPGHLASAPVISGHRRVTSGASNGSAQNLPTTGDSFAQYLSTSRGSQGPIDRRYTPSSDGGFPTADDTSPIPMLGDKDEYYFSQGTLSRAEKARNTIELSYEYKRLLQYLPPLKPSASGVSDRNGTTNFSASGSSYGGNKLHPTETLGRAYNPLQYIRNKQIRRAARMPLDGAADGWDNIFTVKAWIDSVGLEALRPKYAVDDVAFLPPWTSPAVQVSPSLDKSNTNIPSNLAKPVLSKVDWSFKPEDLLADAYWLEQDDHKASIESKDGNRIYQHFRRPRAASVDSTRFPELVPDTALREQPPSFASEDPISPKSNQSHGSEADHDGGEIPIHGMPHSESRAARITRKFFHRSRGESVASSSMSISDDERHMPSYARKRRRSSTLENVGPLKRHMERLMAKESHESRRRSFTHSASPPLSPSQPEHGRRMALQPHERTIQEEPTDSREFNVQHSRNTSHESAVQSRQDSGATGFTHTPRVSVEDVDALRPRALQTRRTGDSEAAHSTADEDLEMPHGKQRAHRLGFLRRRKSKEHHNIEVTDFAAIAAQKEAMNGNSHANQSRPDLLPRASSHGSISKLNKLKPANRSMSHNNLSSLADGDEDEDARLAKRFFKGGRIGELVKTEKPRAGEIVWKRQAPRSSSVTSLATPSDSSGAENAPKTRSPSPKKAAKPPLKATSSSNNRSQTSHEPSKRRYHIKNLPSFVSSSTAKRPNGDLFRTGSKLTQKPSPADVRTKLKEPRLAVPEEDSNDVSPNTSSPDLTRLRANTFLDPSDADRRGSYGFPALRARSSSASSRSSHSPAPFEIDQSAGRFRTGLADLEPGAPAPRRKHRADAPSGHRTWSIADGATAAPAASRLSPVTRREIAYVRSLLLSSGVKAKAIVLAANSPPIHDFPFLIRAAATANTPVPPRTVRREQHVLAARLLSRELEAGVRALESAAQRFRGETAQGLHARVDDLRERLNSRLTPLVRSAADDADACVARLTTTHTLAVKQVNDAVDAMVRGRQRRLRWLRGAGFRLLEWLVVGFMWWIWLFVWVFHVVRAVVVFLLRPVLWLVWR